MQPQINGHPRVPGIGKKVRGVFFAALIIVVGLIVNFTQIPRAAFYSVFREVNRFSINLQTRDWLSLAGDHFEVRYHPQDQAVAALVLNTAEQSFEPVNNMLGYVPKDRTLVLVYPTRRDLGKSFGWTADQSAMGVYWAGIIRVLSPAAWIDCSAEGEMAERFRSSGPMVHEYSHLTVDYITRGNYPRWLTEGIAQYVEREITGFSFSDGLSSPEEEWFSLKDLENNFDNPQGQAKAYRQALAMMDYLVIEYGEDAYIGILQRLGRGAGLDKAWREETGTTPEEFFEDFCRWHNSVVTSSLRAW